MKKIKRFYAHRGIWFPMILLTAVPVISIIGSYFNGRFSENILDLLMILGILACLWFCFIASRVFSVIDIDHLEIRAYNIIWQRGIKSKIQSIAIKDIRYCYFYKKEVSTILSLKKFLKKKNIAIANNENDFSYQNLNNKYGVSHDIYEAWKDSVCKIDEDTIYTEIIILADYLASEHKLSNSTKEKLIDGLSDDQNFTQSYFKQFLTGPMSEELKRYIDSFLNTVLINDFSPFLKTDSNLIQLYEKTLSAYSKNSRTYVRLPCDRLDQTFVLSNEDGSKKAYLFYFLAIPPKKWRDIFYQIKIVNSDFKIMMPKSWIKEHVSQ